jgi:hypothetical protein
MIIHINKLVEIIQSIFAVKKYHDKLWNRRLGRHLARGCGPSPMEEIILNVLRKQSRIPPTLLTHRSTKSRLVRSWSKYSANFRYDYFNPFPRQDIQTETIRAIRLSGRRHWYILWPSTCVPDWHWCIRWVRRNTESESCFWGKPRPIYRIPSDWPVLPLDFKFGWIEFIPDNLLDTHNTRACVAWAPGL